LAHLAWDDKLTKQTVRSVWAGVRFGSNSKSDKK
jgi:hypothetical protein